MGQLDTPLLALKTAWILGISGIGCLEGLDMQFC
jgi:hypothetical protein